jgi:hypothetical protein
VTTEEKVDRMWERQIEKIDRITADSNPWKMGFVSGFWFALALKSMEQRIRRRVD